MITTPKSSPFQVTYDDMIEATETRIRSLEKRQLAGYYSWSLTHEIAVQKQILALMKKFKKDPQIDLFKQFENG